MHPDPIMLREQWRPRLSCIRNEMDWKEPSVKVICGACKQEGPWTCIFHVRPHSMARLIFISEKIVWKSWSRHLFYFILKGKIKQERKS